MTQETPMKAQAITRPDFSKCIREDGSIMDIKGFTGVLAGTKLYWVVMAEGIEWNFVLKRIADEFVGKDRPDPNPLAFLVGLPDEYPEYGRFYMPSPPDIHFFRRSRVPAEVLAVRLGVPVGAVTKAKYITLSPTQAMLGHGLPKPTVAAEHFSTTLH